jgi:hypothetical protein
MTRNVLAFVCSALLPKTQLHESQEHFDAEIVRSVTEFRRVLQRIDVAVFPRKDAVILSLTCLELQTYFKACRAQALRNTLALIVQAQMHKYSLAKALFGQIEALQRNAGSNPQSRKYVRV